MQANIILSVAEMTRQTGLNVSNVVVSASTRSFLLECKMLTFVSRHLNHKTLVSS